MLVDDPMVGVVVGSFCGFVVMISIAGFGCGLPVCRVEVMLKILKRLSRVFYRVSRDKRQSTSNVNPTYSFS